MKIFIISSASFYEKIEPVKLELEKMGHTVFLPNTYDNPNLEKETWEKGFEAHAELEKELLKKSEETIKNVDAVLCVNYEKHGIEMGFDSAAAYEEAASAVINNPDALYKTEKEDGDGVYYVEATNEFVILSTDGYIRTYFYPNGGINYFNRQ